MVAMLYGLLTALIILGLDQWTKQMMLEALFYQSIRLEIAPFFHLTPVWNYGVSFGMFQTDSATGAHVLIGVALLITTIMAYVLWRTADRYLQIAIGFIIGGALGNVIDRFRFGAVVDFFDFHLNGYHWPAFNVADAAITLGVILIIIDHFTSGEKEVTNTVHDYW